MVCIHFILTRLHIDDQHFASVAFFYFRPYLLLIQRFAAPHDFCRVSTHCFVLP